jgi:hypothetical protein
MPDAALEADASEGGPSIVQQWDVGRDFSATQDPSGVWRYGSTSGSTLALAAFVLDTAPVTVPPINFWHPSVANYYPYVAATPNTTLTTDASDSWALRPGEIAMEASNSGQFSVIQFVVPEDGAYQIQARFEGIHTRLSTTDAHVRRGDTALFDTEIDGYGGDPSFHAITGTNPSATYSDTLTLQANEILSFALGYGSNGTNYNDTTGLMLHIALLR